MEDRRQKMEDRGWKMEDGRWRMEDGREQLPSSILYSLSSILHFPFSVFRFLVILGLCFLGPAGALGNGVPVKVFLNYLPGISNWGPETAKGEAVLAVGEGWATVSVQGLPKLQDEVYLAWVIPQEGSPIPIGKFDTDDAGAGDFEIRGLSLPEVPYKLFLVTVERDSDRYEGPSDRRTIAGRFLDPELRPPPSPAPTQAPGSGGSSGEGSGTGGDPDAQPAFSLAQPAPTRPAPAMLPVTGGVVEPDRRVTPAFWAAAGLAGLAVFRLLWSITSHRLSPQPLDSADTLTERDRPGGPCRKGGRS